MFCCCLFASSKPCFRFWPSQDWAFVTGVPVGAIHFSKAQILALYRANPAHPVLLALSAATNMAPADIINVLFNVITGHTDHRYIFLFRVTSHVRHAYNRPRRLQRIQYAFGLTSRLLSVLFCFLMPFVLVVLLIRLLFCFRRYNL